MPESDLRRRPQFQLITILKVMVCDSVYLAIDRAASGLGLIVAGKILALAYAVMTGVCLLGRSSRFA